MGSDLSPSPLLNNGEGEGLEGSEEVLEGSEEVLEEGLEGLRGGEEKKESASGGGDVARLWEEEVLLPLRLAASFFAHRGGDEGEGAA